MSPRRVSAVIHAAMPRRPVLAGAGPASHSRQLWSRYDHRLLFTAVRILIGLPAAALVLVAACGGGSSSSPTASQAPPATASLALATVTPSVASVTGAQCGVERWPVKTLSDQDATR